MNATNRQRLCDAIGIVFAFVVIFVLLLIGSALDGP